MLATHPQGGQAAPVDRFVSYGASPRAMQAMIRGARAYCLLAGVYLVRARCGAEVVSAGLVHSVSGETATGRVNRKLLQRVCELTGGSLLGESDEMLPPIRAGHSHFVELTPLLLKLLLLLFVADVAIRRWENVQGMLSILAFIRGPR